MLISEEYKKMNKELHGRNVFYGSNGANTAIVIKKFAEELGTKDILDYGCGKSTLSENLPYAIKQYDPAIDKYSALPQSADLVVCTDVLEHVEPECLEDVLAHLKSLAKKAIYLNISTQPAKKKLSDGRNAHICLHDARWWVNKIWEYFSIHSLQTTKGDIVIIGVVRC